MLRIFGRTTLVSQFMVRSEMRETHSSLFSRRFLHANRYTLRLKTLWHYMASRTNPDKPPLNARFAGKLWLIQPPVWRPVRPAPATSRDRPPPRPSCRSPAPAHPDCRAAH